MTDSLNQTDLIQEKIPSKNKGGRPANPIWDDIIKGVSVGFGKFQATCKFCKETWTRGEVSKLEEHLANHCSEAPGSIVRKYLARLLEREDKGSKKRKFVESDQTNMKNFLDSTKIPDSRITRINRALAKFFIACGISFRVVEHPFFINFVKELNAGYDLPTREYLSDHLLERELATVNSNANNVIENENNLTLGLLILNMFFFSNILTQFLSLIYNNMHKI